MSMLAAPDTITGPLTAQDLDAARQHSTGRIVHLRRATLLPAGCDQQGRHATRQWPAFPDTVPTDWHGLDACAPEGGKRAEPVPSAQKKRDVNGARIGFVLLLLSATTVVGMIFGAIYARWPIAWPLG